MTTLRDQIQDEHKRAEHSKFSQLLLSGNIPKQIYAEYLYNQYFCYKALEQKSQSFNLFDDFPEIVRSNLMKEDLNEMGTNITDIKIHPSTIKYLEHITQSEEPDLLLAHIYVRHFGDMYGGQIIKTKVPSSGKMYEFENRQELISKVRSKLNDDMGTEAKVCFKFINDLFDDLSNEHNL